MLVRLHVWNTSTRPCRFSLDLQDCSVYADFDVDAAGLVYARRVSLDGYGCCDAPVHVGHMNRPDSLTLLRMVEAQAIDVAIAGPLLRRYFNEIAEQLWSDALQEHQLL